MHGNANVIAYEATRPKAWSKEDWLASCLWRHTAYLEAKWEANASHLLQSQARRMPSADILKGMKIALLSKSKRVVFPFLFLLMRGLNAYSKLATLPSLKDTEK